MGIVERSTWGERPRVSAQVGSIYPTLLIESPCLRLSRVIARSRPVHPRNDVYEPLSWPEASPPEDDSSRNSLLSSLIRQDDLPEVSTL